MLKNFSLLIGSAILLCACSGSTESNSYYELPAGTTEVYRFECQVAPADFIADILGSYTDPTIRAILKEIGGPDQIEPNAFFDALLTESKANNYKLGENFSRATTGLFEEGSSDEDIIEVLKSEYTSVLSANLERFHTELTNHQLAHNIYLSPSNQLIVELMPADDYDFIKAMLQTKKRNFIEFRPVYTIDECNANILYMFDVTASRVDTVEMASTDLLSFSEPVIDTVSITGLYGQEFWNHFMLAYTFDYEGSPTGFSTSGEIGWSKLRDTSYVNRFMQIYKDSMPVRFDWAWGSPVINNMGEATDMVYLYFLKPADSKNAINPADIVSAETKADEHMPGWFISITFATTGVTKWSDITAASIGLPIGIILDNTVVSAPIVQQQITSGVCEIHGDFTEEEATDLTMRINHSLSAYPMVIVKQGPATLEK